MLSIQSSLGARLGLGNLPYRDVPDDLWAEIAAVDWLVSGEREAIFLKLAKSLPWGSQWTDEKVFFQILSTNI